MIRVIIPLRTPSMNLWHRRRGLASYHPIKLEWYIRLRAKLVPQLQETRRMRLEIRTYRHHLLDVGNLWGGTKPIPDALVKLGYLKDDSPAWCTFHVEQFQVKDCPERTEILISEAT